MEFRFDHTNQHAGNQLENAQSYASHQPTTMAERMRAAVYLNIVAYGYDIANPLRLDCTAFATRQHAHHEEEQ